MESANEVSVPLDARDCSEASRDMISGQLHAGTSAQSDEVGNETVDIKLTNIMEPWVSVGVSISIVTTVGWGKQG